MTTMYIRHDGLNWQWNDTLRSQSTHKEMLTKIFSLDIQHPPFNGAFLINSENLKNLISR